MIESPDNHGKQNEFTAAVLARIEREPKNVQPIPGRHMKINFVELLQQIRQIVRDRERDQAR